MSIKSRLAVATVISPLTIAPVVLVAVPVLQLETILQFPDSYEAWHFLEEWLAITMIFGIAGGITAVFANLFIGLPVYALLRYFDLAMPVPCALLGGAIVLVAGEAMQVEPLFYSLAALCGAAVGAAFCRLANGPRR